jgi:histone H3/H4
MTEIRVGTLEKVLREQTGFRVSGKAAAELKLGIDAIVEQIAIAAKDNAKHAGRVTLEEADIKLAIHQVL